MDPIIALQNVNAICRAYSCNADQRDIVNQSLEALRQCVEIAQKVSEPVVIASPHSIGAENGASVVGTTKVCVDPDKMNGAGDQS